MNGAVAFIPDVAAFVTVGSVFCMASWRSFMSELDHEKRASMLAKMQQLVHEKSIYAPIWQLGFLNGVSPRVGESGFGQIPGFAYTAPFEDLTIKS